MYFFFVIKATPLTSIWCVIIKYYDIHAFIYVLYSINMYNKKKLTLNLGDDKNMRRGEDKKGVLGS